MVNALENIDMKAVFEFKLEENFRCSWFNKRHYICGACDGYRHDCDNYESKLLPKLDDKK
jgi:hypothetical protein